ncbi:hypothetical protein Scep_011544 [Stephania cephalantha]|uniref:Uncharacterized protein n=1 Tax=Stephania cephalantha TaxID=152367 RepID=A0AAP0JF06_9MAGN
MAAAAAVGNSATTGQRQPAAAPARIAAPASAAALQPADDSGGDGEWYHWRGSASLRYTSRRRPASNSSDGEMTRLGNDERRRPELWREWLSGVARTAGWPVAAIERMAAVATAAAARF